jgi:NAD(P)H-hydrate epimerase
MGVLSCKEMRTLEENAFATGITAEELMDKAGLRIGQALVCRFPSPGTAVAFIGKGNNGGDALVALRWLVAQGWTVAVRCPFGSTDLGVLPRRKLRMLSPDVLREDIPSATPRPLVLLDGLLGIGALGALREPLASMAKEMARLRREHGAHIVAIDIPSGVDGDTGEIYDCAVRAEWTLTVGVPKIGLLNPRAVSHIGRLELIALEELPVPKGGDLRLITPHTLDFRPEPRPADLHKGRAGKIAVVAGGPGTTGAAVLCGHAALKAGGGLVTLFVPASMLERVAVSAPPELMVRPFTGPDEILGSDFDALAAGPGVGPVPNPEFLELIERSTIPTVVDADGLNQIAASGRLDLLGPRTVVTPHPGEFRRLAPDLAGLPPLEAARAFADRHPTTLVLKGARSIVASASDPLWINSTGTPGMATAGQGDVLTGVIAALLATGTSSIYAAALGCWLCGRASERAIIDHSQSESSLTAGSTLALLGSAFNDWRNQIA